MTDSLNGLSAESKWKSLITSSAYFLPVDFRARRGPINKAYLRHLSLKHFANWERRDQVSGTGCLTASVGESVWVFFFGRAANALMEAGVGLIKHLYVHKRDVEAVRAAGLKHIWAKCNFLPKWQTRTWKSKLGVTQQKHTQQLQNPHNSLLPALHSQVNLPTSTLRTVWFISIDAAPINI